MEKWLKEINYKFYSGASHTFLLHLNVADNFLAPTKEEKLETLSARLVSHSPLSQAKFVAFYNLGEGIKFVDDEMESEFLLFLEILFPKKLHPDLGSGNAAVEEFKSKRRSLDYALGLFSLLLKKSWKEIAQLAKKNKELEELLKIPKNFSGKPFFGAVLEYVETIIPPNSANAPCKDDRGSLVSILVLAKDPSIHSAHNVLFLLAEGLSSVTNQLCSETNGIVPIKIDFPDFKNRESLYKWLRKDCPPKQEDLDATRFGRHSAGMSSNAIISLVAEMSFKSEPLTMATLFDRKKKFIEDQSGGLLEVMRPLWGIKAIGGLDEHKRYIMDVVKLMKANNFSSIPMGIMLLGAPGTGKTVFAQAISYEAELPFVSLKNIREVWHGQSEKNLDFALELIMVLAPVVVFMDEIDQAMQVRSSAPSGDSGVSQRLQGKLFQFMADTDLRGKVMWIAASNRPDLIDPALLRPGRFDKRIPFFPPSTKERVEIFRAIIHKNRVVAESQNTPFLVEDIKDETIKEFARQAHCHLADGQVAKCSIDEFHSITGLDVDKDNDDEIYFTGGQLESIVVDANFLASLDNKPLSKEHLFKALENHLPPTEIHEYQQMTELALRYCNDVRFIPKEGRWYKTARRLGIIRASNTAKPILSD